MGKLIDYTPVDLPKRGLWESSMEHWSSGEGDYHGEKCLVCTYYDKDGVPVAAKLRFQGKKFMFIGDPSKAVLFGQHLWQPTGRSVIITEGELDAISISQIQNHKYPVVSIPNGASGAAKAIKKNLIWLSGFESVVLCFDMDEPGQKAASEVAQLLPPGVCKVMKLPKKDASEMLSEGLRKELIEAYWRAPVWRPDGLVEGDEVWEMVVEDKAVPSLPYPWMGLNVPTMGIRKSELTLLLGGSGVGKSTVCRELAAHLISMGERVGYAALEENVGRSVLGILGVMLDRPLHLEPDLEVGDLRAAFDSKLGGSAVFYNHFGSVGEDTLLANLRYMTVGMDCGWVILDHISIVTSGMEGDERRSLDQIMTKLRSLVQETGMGLIVVSHLKRPQGTAHEEGGAISVTHARGSHSLAQLSDMILGFEAGGEEAPNTLDVVVLKNRYSGQRGRACTLNYDLKTGRLHEAIEREIFPESHSEDVDASDRTGGSEEPRVNAPERDRVLGY